MAKGAHGNYGTFLAFFLPNVAGLVISWQMLRAKVFSKTTSLIGILGSILMILYVILVTFNPSAKTMATAIAMPGGLLLMTWMILYTFRLFKLEV